jgi:uncharacterized membrane protein YcfT
VTQVKQRVDWVDYAKGICIVLVVAMHSTLGVEKAAGQLSALHGFIDWARPFRMPDFFLISGLFLASRIDRPWRAFLDTKVLHFAYFYVLWMSIQFLTKGHDIYLVSGLPGLVREYAMGFVEPFGTLWFIYILAVFFPLTKALRAVPSGLVFAAAAGLEMLHLQTGHLLVDEFASRFVYFFTGYWLAKTVFRLADAVDRLAPFEIFTGLLVWAALNFIFVSVGLSTLPGISLGLGLVGAMAVVSSGVLLSKFRVAGALRYCGENSIVIYLAFFLFMATARSLLLHYASDWGLSLIAGLTTAAGVTGPVLLFWATCNTKLKFLFKRPQWAILGARLANEGKGWHSAPHVREPAPAFQPQARGSSLSH